MSSVVWFGRAFVFWFVVFALAAVSPRTLGQTAAVAGQVVDLKGSPIAGAKVRALRARVGAFVADDFQLARDADLGRAALAEATAGADGRFLLSGLEPGWVDVTAAADGYETKLVDARVAASKPLGDFKIRLGPGFKIAGRVLTKDGVGLEGFRVRVADRMSGWSLLHSAPTQKDGKYVIEGLGRGDYMFAACKPGHLAARDVEVTIPRKTPVEFTIEDEAVLEGVVTSADGKPVAGAEVLAFVVPDNVRLGRTGDAYAVTDASGRYDIRGLGGQLRKLRIKAKGHAPFPEVLDPAWADHEKALLVLKTGKNEYSTKLAKPGAVRGRVVSRGDKKPLAGAVVHLINAASHATERCLTGSDGAFAFGDVNASKAMLVAFHADYVQCDLAFSALGELLSALTNDASGELAEVKGAILVDPSAAALEATLEMAALGRVLGRVLSPLGDPVVGAAIDLVPGEDAENSHVTPAARLPVLSDEKGRFECAAPWPGTKSSARGTADEYVEARSATFETALGEGHKGLIIKMRQGGYIRGVVNDPKKNPVAGAFVELEVRSSASESGRFNAMFASKPGFRTGDDGAFHSELMEPGAVRLTARFEGFAESEFKDVVVPSGRAVEVLLTLEEGLTITGSVVDDEGKPVAGAHVGKDGEDDDDRRFFFGEQEAPKGGATTDALGKFTLGGLKKGAHRIRASKSDRPAVEPVVLDAGVSDAVIKLPRGVGIAGTVRCKDAAVEGASVELVALGDDEKPTVIGNMVIATNRNRRWTKSKADGSFAFEGLKRGSYRLVVGPGNFVTDRINILPKTIDQVDAPSEPIVVEVEEGCVVSGRVTIAEKIDDFGGSVVLQREDEANAASEEVERMMPFDFVRGLRSRFLADGAFLFNGLSPGRYHVIVQARGFGGRRLAVEAGSKDVAISIAGGSTVKGRLLDSGGKPQSNATVHLRIDGVASTTTSERDGTFEIKHVLPGTGSLAAYSFRSSSYRQATRESIEVVDGKPLDLGDITLKE